MLKMLHFETSRFLKRNLKVYKQFCSCFYMLSYGKRGQVTIFIIVALVVVVLVVLLAYFWGDIKSIGVEATPQKFVESCMSDPIEDSVSSIFEHGGVIENKNSVLFKGQAVEYLCYTNEYYKTCVMQKPLLKDSVEKELNIALKLSSENCIISLKKDLENKGFTVNSGVQRTTIFSNLSLGRADFIITAPLTLTKGDDSQTIASFRISNPSKLYELVMSAVYILNWEARYGDFDTLTFMLSYPDFRLEKQKLSEGSKVYILSSRSTNEKFVFASRSISWPPGYATGERVGE